MKVFLIQLLSIIFVLLITGSIQSVTADHLEPGKGLFKDEETIETAKTEDSNYRIHLQTVLRNADGQLIGVMHGPMDGLHGWVIPHKVTDHVFDTLMGEKEIVTIDNIKYEKATYSAKPPMEELISEYNRPIHFNGNWQFKLCADFAGHDYVCIPVFHANTALLPLEISDVVTTHWTILRELN